MEEFHLFIASCKENESNIHRIIDNIITTDIPLDKVHIISGGYDIKNEEIINGIQVIKVNYRCFEFTPMIYVVKNKDKLNFDYGFFTHDTVIFGNNFYSKVGKEVKELKDKKLDSKRITEHGLAMNIGICSKESIINQEKILIQELCLNTNDSKKLWDMKQKLVKYEDFIFFKSKRLFHRNAPLIHQMKIKNIENKETPILCKVFREIDLIKIQTNFDYIKSTTPPQITNEFKNLLK